ncbi:hypothetical protein DXG01_000336 [Tephrocybe rancida]|nr:hypothetical protein DXG01_000336 [Tephrocybe rancida]
MVVSIRVAAISLIVCLQSNVVSTSPAQFGSARQPHRHTKWIWARQARQELPLRAEAASWPTNHAPEAKQSTTNDPPFQLPPVADVFKKVADAESHQGTKPIMTSQAHASPTVAPQALVLPPSPTASASSKADSAPVPTSPPSAKIAAALVPTTAIVQPTSQDSYRGPGLVIPSSIPGVSSTHSLDEPSGVTGPNHPKISSTVPSGEPNPISDATQPTSETVNPSHDASIPHRKLVVIGAAMAGLIVLMFLAYFVLVRRSRRKEEKGASASWKKIDSPPPPGIYYGAEKEVDYQPSTPLSQRSASSIYSSQSRVSGSNTVVPGAPADDVIDITTNYPRSKFSLCSSEYPVSISSESYARSDSLVHPPLNGEHVDAALLPTYQFYCQPPEPLEDRRHSRAYSVPIVAHASTPGTPELMVRAIQHRRSRSVSGLAYTVKPQEQRESGSSAGGWGESPQSPSGWPSAI